MRKSFSLILSLISLAAGLAGCGGGYKTPTLSGDPHSMSADTLCYRHAYARRDEALQAEVAARNLDCDDILEPRQPPFSPDL